MSRQPTRGHLVAPPFDILTSHTNLRLIVEPFLDGVVTPLEITACQSCRGEIKFALLPRTKNGLVRGRSLASKPILYKVDTFEGIR